MKESLLCFWLVFAVSLLFLEFPLAGAVVGIEKDPSLSMETANTYIVSLERHLTKQHYEQLVEHVKDLHNDEDQEDFQAEVGKEMKGLKMFTIVNPSSRALKYLQEHEHVKNVQADRVVYAAKEDM